MWPWRYGGGEHDDAMNDNSTSIRTAGAGARTYDYLYGHRHAKSSLFVF